MFRNCFVQEQAKKRKKKSFKGSTLQKTVNIFACAVGFIGSRLFELQKVIFAHPRKKMIQYMVQIFLLIYVFGLHLYNIDEHVDQLVEDESYKNKTKFICTCCRHIHMVSRWWPLWMHDDQHLCLYSNLAIHNQLTIKVLSW